MSDAKSAPNIASTVAGDVVVTGAVGRDLCGLLVECVPPCRVERRALRSRPRPGNYDPRMRSIATEDRAGALNRAMVRAIRSEVTYRSRTFEGGDL